MTNHSNLTVSIVIPAYNEANYIRGCLESIARQTVAPVEIIVVDNNSTDETAAIASEFTGVRVVSEHTQGISPARTRGFDEARGDIIGRIDADSRLARGWVEIVIDEFQNDTSCVAIGGPSGITELSPRGHVWWTWTSHLFQYLQRRALRVSIPLLYGNNMALRRSAWLKVRDEAQTDDARYHEDIDLGFTLTRVGRVRFVPRLRVSVSGRRMLDMAKVRAYRQKDIATRDKHFGV